MENGEAMRWLKVIEENDEELVSTLENMTTAELKDRVIQSQVNLLESERKRKNDEALAKARARHDYLRGPYDDAKKLQTAIVQYGLLLLEERGVSLE